MAAAPEDKLAKPKFPWRPVVFALALIWIGLWVAGFGERDEFITKGEKSGGGADAMETFQQAAVEPVSVPGKYGGTYTDCTISDPKTFNLWVATDSGSSGASGPLFDSLVTQNPFTQKWEPRLCQLPVVSPDGRTWTFKLRDGVKWSDGVPMTADDLIFTLDMIFDPKTAGSTRESMLVSVPDKTDPTGFKEVPPKYSKVDDRTIQFVLPVPYAPAITMLNFNPAPSHVLYSLWKSGQINSAWNVSTPPSQLVGSGPWLMQEYVPGQRLVYKRNPYFWRHDAWGRPLPYFDHYVQLIVPDLNAESLKFKSGETDSLGVQPDDYPATKRGEADGGYTVYDLGPGFETNYLSFNLNPDAKLQTPADQWKIGLFQQEKFRQAVSFALNRDLMCINQFRGLARPLWSDITPANKIFYDPKVPEYPYNPEKAGQLLDEIGARYVDGSPYRQYQGHEIDFVLETNVENSVRKELGIVISKDLKNIGLNVTFVPVAFNKMITSLDDPPHNWEAIIIGFGGDAEPNDVCNLWYSFSEQHDWDPKEKTPATPWEAKIDDLFARGAQEMDPKKRVAIYDEFQKVASTELPLIYTVCPDSIMAVRNKFGNLKPCALGGYEWNTEELFDLSATGTAPSPN